MSGVITLRESKKLDAKGSGNDNIVKENAKGGLMEIVQIDITKNKVDLRLKFVPAVQKKAAYVFGKASTPTITLSKGDKARATTTIPATVAAANGVTYKVTGISANAFKGNKTLKTLKGGKNVTSIGKNAFNGCSKLKTMNLTGKVTTIGAGAFQGVKFKKVTINANKLKSVGKKAFKGSGKKTKITVKAKNKKIYKKAVKKLKKAGAKKAKFKYKKAK